MSIRYTRVLSALAVVGVAPALALAAVASADATSAGPASAAAAVAPPDIQIINGYGRAVPTAFRNESTRLASAQTYDVGDPQTTQWACVVDPGDGSAPGGSFPTRPGIPGACTFDHLYSRTGTYHVTMTVTDPSGDSATSSRDVQVTRRPIYVRNNLVEGTPVTLRAPGNPSQVDWRNDGLGRCSISDPTAAVTEAVCSNQGDFLFIFDGDSTPGSSGEYLVTYRNGAPAPTVDPVRFRGASGDEVPSPRIGTGDEVAFLVDGHDPSWDPAEHGGPLAPRGDDLTCHFDYGDGTTAEDGDRGSDRCVGFHVYTEAGTYTTTVTVSDDVAATTATVGVEVVRRDVTVVAQGQTAGGLRGRVSGRLRPAGVTGAMRFTTPEGRHVVVDHVSSLTVESNYTSLGGLATVDGRSGYYAYAQVYRGGQRAVGVQVLTGRGGPAGRYVEQADGLRPDFTTSYQARPIS